MVLSVTFSISSTLASAKTIGEFLVEIGRARHVHFTVESAYSGPRQYLYLGVPYSTDGSSVPVEASAIPVLIERIIPNYVVLRDDKITSIFHIIDKRLLSNPKYILNQPLGKVRYSGNLQEYVAFLSGQLRKPNSLTYDKGLVLGDGPLTLDTRTPVEIASRDLEVRQALSEIIPSHYDWIAWTSATDLDTMTTSIKFPGSNLDLDGIAYRRTHTR